MSRQISAQTKASLSRGNDAVANFHRAHPDFDLLNFDFYGPDAVNSMPPTGRDPAVQAQLQAQQRIVRLTDNDQAAAALLQAGFDSAHSVAALPEHKFKRDFKTLFNGNEETARAVHQRAAAIKGATKHLYANIHSMVGSAHYGALTANNVGSGVADYFESIPTYWQLFGPLNYCTCKQCASIFGAAAYFLDLMRITDDYITDPNITKTSNNIPTGYQLSQRRPDLFELPLTCANTDDPVPTLSIINQILARNIGNAQQQTAGAAVAATTASITLAANASSNNDAYNGMWIVITAGTGLGQLRTIASYVGSSKVASLTENWTTVPDTTSRYVVSADPYQTLAAAPYPFNLPANLPLIEIRRYLAALKTTLAEIYGALLPPVNSGTAQAGAATSLTLAASASTTDGAYNTMMLMLVAGAGAGQRRMITAYAGSTRLATVDQAWATTPDNTTQYVVFDALPTDREIVGLSIEQYQVVTTPQTTNAQIAPYYGYTTIDLAQIAHVELFLKRSGLGWDELEALLTQELSDSELKAGVANTFFINATGEGLPAMQITVNDTNPEAPYFQIANISLLRLDRLYRFIRLANALGWDYAALDWAMKSVNALEITEAAIKAFAGIQQLRTATELDVVVLTALWAPMKTIGQGNGRFPIDLFDRIFNSPALLRGQNPYTSVTAIPFNPARPLTWTIADTSGSNGVIRSRLSAALNVGDDDLTRVSLFVGAVTSASPVGTLALNLANLTWLYRLTKAAAMFEMSVDAYLILLGLMYVPETPLEPGPSIPVPTVAGVLAQKELVDWFTDSPFTVYSALYVLTGATTPYFTPAYRPDDIAPFVQNLATVAAGSRLVPQSFVFGQIEALQADRIFTKLVQTDFITSIGILLSQSASYEAAAEDFPLTAQSFITPDIPSTKSAIVFQDLQSSHPPILLPVDGGAKATLAQHVTPATPLDFLFPGDANAPNKRNEVMAILMATKAEIAFTELAFVFVVTGDSFVSDDITPAQSQRSFQALASQSPALIAPDPANGQTNTITSYAGATRIATVSSAWTTPPDRASAYAIMQPVTNGTARGGTITTITLASTASSLPDAYVGMRLKLTGGTGNGQIATILAYDGSTQVATVAPAWVTIPDSTSAYAVAQAITAGIAVAGTTTTITLDDAASTSDNAYAAMTVELGLAGQLTTNFTAQTTLDFLFVSKAAGQSATISAYDGPTRTATVATAWSPAEPDATSFYQVIQTATQGTAQAGGGATITLATGASGQDGAYDGMTIKLTGGTGAGQSGIVFAYDGATRVATMQNAWSTAPDATSVYAVTQVLTQGMARAGSTTTIALAADASATAGAYNTMTVSILPDPQAALKRGEVKEALLTAQQNIAHTKGVIEAADALQQNNAMQGLADFLGTTPDRLRVLIPAATEFANLADYLDDLLTPIEKGQVPPELPPFIAGLSRGVVLFDTLAFTIPQILAVVEIPQAFAVNSAQEVTLSDLESFTDFKVLVQRFGNQSDRLIDYLRRPLDATCPGATTFALSALTHWPAAQICTLETQFWPLGVTDAAHGPDTVPGLLRLDACFRISDATGLDIGSLLQLNALGTLPVAASGAVIAANWQTYVSMTTLTLAAVSAKFGDQDFVAVNSSIIADLNEARRDALLGYTIWLLQQTYTEIVSADALYQYLLIDVQMCGCDTTSYIAQAIASVQLYMQRCRLMLEPGVTDLSNIPEVWWEWMSNYRIWEANRKIFLYPENYIEPALRTNTTPQFKDLVDELMQTDVSERSVTKAYETYFDGYTTVAQLTKAAAYSCRLPKLGSSTVYAQGTAVRATANSITLGAGYSRYYNAYTGMTIKITGGAGAGQVNGITIYDGYGTATVATAWKTVPDNTSTYVITGPQQIDTLYLVAHTNTQPPIYYWRSHDSLYGWSPWTEIKLSIASPFVSPLYAFNKLFLFWVEQKTVDGSMISSPTGGPNPGPQSTTITDISASIKFSYRNADGNWLPTQALADDIVISYELGYALDPYVSGAMGGPLGYAPSFEPEWVYWQKVNPLYIPATQLAQPGQYPTGDRIFVNYGFAVGYKANQTLPVIDPPVQTMPPAQYQIEYNTYLLVNRNNAIAGAPIQTGTGFLPFQSGRTLDSSLVRSDLDLALVNNMQLLNPQPYWPMLARSSNALGMAMATSWNLILTNYQSDNYPNSTSNFFNGTTIGQNLLGSITGKTASVVTVKNNPGAFIFDNADEAFLVRSSDTGIMPITDIVTGSYQLVPYPAGAAFYVQTQNFTATQTAPPLNQLKFSFDRITTTTARSLMQRLLRGGIPNLLTLEAQLTPEPPFSRLGPTSSVIAPPSDRLDFKGAYGLYCWEVFFHAPFLVAESLRANQRFREAKEWFEYIYNPTQQPEKSDGTDADRYWRFLPFRTMTIQTLTQILADPAQIAVYNDHPFDPDAIARLRTVAYAKAIVMKYISNLLAWGDFLYAQDTRESINEATNLYVLASDLLGPRPIAVGDCDTPAPMSFNDIKAEYNNQTIITGTAAAGAARTITLASGASAVNDAYTGYYIAITGGAGNGQTAYITAYAGQTRIATVELPWQTVPNNTSQYRVFAQGIPQFLIRLENTPIVQAASGTGVPYSDVPFNDINSYFCVPENSELTAYWDLVDDRLFKIRHCMNIAGVVRSLALFEPPINPRALIQAARAGGGSMALASQLNMPIPYYRFAALIERAKGLTAAVTGLGAALLGALEKRDAEALAQLRTAQEKTLLQLTTLVKEQQVEEVKQTGLALNESLQNAQKRQTYYADQIAKGLSDNEIQNIVYMTLATVFNTLAGVTKTAASIGYAVPQFGSPFAMTYGGKQLGNVLTAASGVLEGLGILANFGAQLNLTMAQYRRRESEWQLQDDLATLDVAQIQYQIAANDARQQITNRDLQVHMTTIAQNEAIDFFLKDKFTNEDLYQWMSTRLSTLYFQTYSLALEVARSVQRAFQYETDSDTSYVNFGYWESSRRGLLAGEGLMLALNQMEKAYLDRNSRAYEIEKTVSLLQINPRAVLDFIASGECVFELSEKLFDDDFPGHYCRKTQTIAVSIPAITGPYQNIHATLTQLSNQVIVKPDLNAINYLLGDDAATVPDGSVLRSNWWSNQSVVLSRGLSDNGMFQVAAADERYLPFEGTGAVSTWRLSMPKTTNHFDFNTITDVILQLRYTANDGGAKLRADVTRLPIMRSYSGSDFFATAQRFSTQWYQFLEQPNSPTQQTLSFALADLVPSHVGRAVLTGFMVQLVTPPGVDASSSTPYITLKLGKVTPPAFSVDREGRYVYLFSAKPRMADAEGAASVSFDLSKAPPSLTLTTDPHYLNPAVVHNLLLTLFYDGEIHWS
jgi:hypothetical protein